MNYLQDLLMKNKKLVHLDLSECGLTSDMLIEIAKTV